MKARHGKKRIVSPSLLKQLSKLEEKIQAKGIKIRYEKLEAGGFKPKSGLCKVKGEVYLFIDKRKSPQERKEILLDYANQDILFGHLSEEQGQLKPQPLRGKISFFKDPPLQDHEA